MKPQIKTLRVYNKTADDGYRVLVDRLWPRGLKKEDAHLDLWSKEIAPTTNLRKWFNHQPDLWPEFKRKYLAELTVNKAADELIKTLHYKKIIILLSAAKDEQHTHSLVLREFLLDRL